MALVELIMPKMGESIIEATVLRWLKEVGDPIEEEETVLEVATDKVDSEVPAPVTGTLHEILYKENETVPIGQPIAIISTESNQPSQEDDDTELVDSNTERLTDIPYVPEEPQSEEEKVKITSQGTRFYSPLVKSIAQEEGISMAELEKIKGTGKDGRVTKDDILNHLKIRKETDFIPSTNMSTQATGNVEIIEMDRMRRLIAKHMVEAKQTAPHVSSVVEVDVTNMVVWRERNKSLFQKKYQTKITFTPIILEAITNAIGKFPNINCSVDNDKIILKKDINLGIATALPNGNLIVPVLKQADQYSLSGIAKATNELVNKARNGILDPQDIQDGTFTFTNIGMFNNITGTPIIPLPQAAILAAGVIKKRPVVMETAQGDVIAIRHIMYLSMSYDHRIIDGYLGGSFLNAVGQFLENFDPDRQV